ncbi:MAG TPA: hypothetical protein VKG38_08085 [Solirubrobacteraceae bacterium]|nr:hypothetical protein [Solirubrobacteraceae bacterium]
MTTGFRGTERFFRPGYRAHLVGERVRFIRNALEGQPRAVWVEARLG